MFRNHVTLVGRLTKEIQIAKTASGKSTTRFTLAVERKRAGDDQQSSADFISCIAWDKIAENLSVYTKKGSKIGIEGHISTRNYVGKDGRKVYVTEIVADEVEFLEPVRSAAKENTVEDTQPIPLFEDGSDEALLEEIEGE